MYINVNVITMNIFSSTSNRANVENVQKGIIII